MPAVNGGRPQVHRHADVIAHRSTIRSVEGASTTGDELGRKEGGVPTTFGPLPSSRLLAKQLVPSPQS